MQVATCLSQFVDGDWGTDFLLSKTESKRNWKCDCLVEYRAGCGVASSSKQILQAVFVFRMTQYRGYAYIVGTGEEHLCDAIIRY